MNAYDVVLLPTMGQAVAYRKAAATRGDALFGVTVSTFEAWVADLWELYGDGRAIASRLQREALLRVLCDGEQSCACGLDRVAAACVAEAAGLPAFEAAVADAGEGVLAGVGAAEVQVLRLAAAYYARLEELELVEFGCALAELAPALPARPMQVLLEGAAPLSAAQQAFFTVCGSLDVTVHTAGGNEGPVRAPEGVRVRFAFPSGQYAWPALLADIVRAAVDDDGRAGAGHDAPFAARVVVAASNPSRWRRNFRVRGWRLRCAGVGGSSTLISGARCFRCGGFLARNRGRRILRAMAISLRAMLSVGVALTWPIGPCRRFRGFRGKRRSRLMPTCVRTGRSIARPRASV